MINKHFLKTRRCIMRNTFSCVNKNVYVCTHTHIILYNDNIYFSLYIVVHHLV